MPQYLAPVEVNGHFSIAVCPRCKMKRHYGDLKQDPNTKQMVCKFDCVDIYDPYRLPPKRPDDITLQYPRPDESLVDLTVYVVDEENDYWVTNLNEFVVES